MSAKPWNKLVCLREEVRTGQLSMEEFAADLHEVVNRVGKRPLYEDPAKFFSLTCATPTLRDIALATAERLRGNTTHAIRELELTYGGGKTHTLVTLVHLFRDPDALPDIDTVREFQAHMGGKGPKARIVAICFDKLDKQHGYEAVAPNGTRRNLFQPWSIIAWQVAGEAGLRLINNGEEGERDSPPVDTILERLFALNAAEGLATLVLFDEVLMYASERASKPGTGVHFRTTFLNFLQYLTQAVAKVPTAAFLISLLASDPRKDDEFGRALVSDMANIVARKKDGNFQPVSKDDVAEILRRRLLDPASLRASDAKTQAVSLVAALSAFDPDMARTRDARTAAETRYEKAFPFDPAMMDVLYGKWTNGLPLFQRTRGILRAFAMALRDAESWDTSPVAGCSILLAAREKEGLCEALSEFAAVARADQFEGTPQNWKAILEQELTFARAAQEKAPKLTHREVEQAVVATFLHSQPPSATNIAKSVELAALVASAKPDRIELTKALRGWADRSWFLDEAHLETAEVGADGKPGTPHSWRMGAQPNLKQMHDDARVNRVSDAAIGVTLAAEIKGARWLDEGANALGAKVHRLALEPRDVTSDGHFRYVILGPSGASESGKPSALAARFCEEVNGEDNPRSARNAILLVVPERSGLQALEDRIRDHLGWLEVRKMLAGRELDPIRSGKLETSVSGSKKDIAAALRQAYCIVVTRGSDEAVHAFKLVVDAAKPLFTQIKEDRRSRIEDKPPVPDLLAVGGRYDLWREEEERIRVKTLVDAFAERPKLPKILDRSALLATVSKGCQQGLWVLSLPRPDGSARTWWREAPDETVLANDALEAVQCRHAVLDSLSPALVVPDALEGLAWPDSGLKLSALASHLSGRSYTVQHEGWEEEKWVPRVPEAKVFEAVAAAVATGAVWVTNGPASVWGEAPPAGVVGRTAVLRKPPEAIPVNSLTPEALPDAWSDGKTSTALDLASALANERGVQNLPWKTVEQAITGARATGFITVTPAPGVTWPCGFHEAGSITIGLPATPGGFDDDQDPVDEEPEEEVEVKRALWSRELDNVGVALLAENMGEIMNAASGLTLRFHIAVSVADGEKPTETERKALEAALAKLAAEMA